MGSMRFRKLPALREELCQSAVKSGRSRPGLVVTSQMGAELGASTAACYLLATTSSIIDEISAWRGDFTGTKPLGGNFVFQRTAKEVVFVVKKEDLAGARGRRADFFAGHDDLLTIFLQQQQRHGRRRLAQQQFT